MKKLLSLLSLSVLLSTPVHSVEITDTQFPKQWGLVNEGQSIPRTKDDLTKESFDGIAGKDIRWDSLKNYNIPKDREVVVAVIDSGVDIHHPDLKGRIWKDEERCPGEDTSKGVCNGYNALDKNGNLEDDTGHGTHVAGIIAANRNGFGVAGLAHPQIKIMPVKVLSRETKSFIYKNRLMTDIIADGIRYAVEKGAQVLNLSLGWPSILETKKIKIALKNAIDKNVIVVVASGNNNKEIPTFPCSTPGIICVGAVDNTGVVTSFSNFGGKVDVLAPGEFIVSTYPTEKVESRILRINGYESKKGTSQASPFIAGIAASYKLVHPESTVDQFKAQLYGTADSIEGEKKFTKFGLVNMKKLLKNEVKKFIAPDFKNTLDVKVKGSANSFSLAIPVKNFIGTVENVKVKVTSDKDYVSFLKEDFEIPSLKEGQSHSLLIVGKLASLDVDSNAKIKIEISHDDKVISKTATSVMFAREWEKIDPRQITKVGFGNVPARALLRITQTRKLTNIKRVSDKYQLSDTPQFWFMDPRNKSDEQSSLSLFQEEGKTFKKVDLFFPKRDEILSVFINDTNLDGEMDYMVYSLGKEQENIFLDFFNKDGSRLFKAEHSTWRFPISEFEGLPMKDGFEEAFSWVKVKSDIGNVLVPSFLKVFTVPEIDNGNDILDYRPEPGQHVYYLNPKLEGNEVVVEYRVIDNFTFSEDLIFQGVMNDWDPYSVEKLLPQSKKQRLSGELNFFISVGSEFKRNYFNINVKEVSAYKVKPKFFPGKLVAGNNLLEILSLDNLSVPNGDSSFLVMYDRQNGRYVKESADVVEDQNFKSSGWNNPVFNTITQFDDELESLLLETRYHVQVSAKGEDGTAKNYVLPINRDSAFPGVNFSETLKPVAVERNGKKMPALHIDSTLIFGDRLYHMVFDGKKFYRPVALTFSIPRQCALIDPVARPVDGLWAYTLLCMERGGRASINYYPLKY